MNLTDEQWKEIRGKLGQYFLDYSIVHSKNVVMRYVNAPGPAPMIARAKEVPRVDEFMGILINE